MEVRCYVKNHFEINEYKEICISSDDMSYGFNKYVFVEVDGKIAKVKGIELAKAIDNCMNI